MNILGLNAYHADASAALVQEGQLISAVEEERLNRVKHCAGFPTRAAKACLKGITFSDVQYVALSRNPLANLWRKFGQLVACPKKWRRQSSRLRNSLDVLRTRNRLADVGLAGLSRAHVQYVEHHRAHLASAFFVSPFEEAVVASIDGFGDFSSLMWGIGRGNRIQLRGSTRFPHSLGHFYTAFTQLLGFPKYGDEYKMMGLSAYGEPRFAPKVRDVVRVEDDQVRLNLDYFVHHTVGVEMTWATGEPVLGPIYSGKLIEMFGSPRVPRSELQPHHADLAASVQLVLEECYFALLNSLYKRARMKQLCLAGGVALNCVANGMIFDRTPFEDIYIQPAANDSGTSIGAAFYVWHQVLNRPRTFQMQHVYLGPAFSDCEIESQLARTNVSYQRLSEEQLIDRTAHDLAQGKIIGWFQGRTEFGPRALGNRSILADPRRKDMKDVLNARIKFREPFRPFCPSIIAEAVSDYFENNYPSPFMVQAYKIRPNQRELIPAVTHQDGTGRLQTVERSLNPRYWELLKRFGELTGIPVLINTSFNENEPIVNTPVEALDCFLRTNMDGLVMGSFLLEKSANLNHSEYRRSLAAAATTA